MTTYTNFVPSTVQAFQFQATLDGQVYTVILTWNLFGARFYVNVYDPGGDLVCCRALVGSPTGLAIENLSWADGTVTAMTSVPHGYIIGTVVALTIAGCSPDAFNGIVDAAITGPDTFTYDVMTDPGAASAFGTATYNINLVGGLQDINGDTFSSTIVYREQSQQFEVSP